MQLYDAFYLVFYRGIAAGALGLLAGRASSFFSASEDKLIAAALTHNMTALAKGHDFLVTQFLTAYLAKILFGLGVLR